MNTGKAGSSSRLMESSISVQRMYIVTIVRRARIAAAKRLCQDLHERYPDLKPILVEDAFYANAPYIRQITGYGWLFVLNVKPDSHESLERQFAGRKASKQVKELRITDPQGIKHYFAWTNDLCLRESAIDVNVNYLLYEQTDKKGKVTSWTWITNIPLNPVMRRNSMTLSSGI